MKKSKAIQLVLITSILASCNRPASLDLEAEYNKDLSLSRDTIADTVPYNDPFIQLWYSSFQPYRLWYNGAYHYASPYLNKTGQNAVIGEAIVNVHGGILRGGFGGSHFSVSS